MSKHQKRRLLPGVLAAAGTVFTGIAAVASQVPGGIFAALSVLSWLGAVYTAGRLR